MKRYVIIGASAAGLSAVKALRKFDPECDITVVSVDDAIYMRTMLPKLLSGEKELPGIRFVPPAFFESQRALWKSGVAVAAIDTAAHAVRLETGKTIAYDKLLIASGATAFVPPVAGLREASNAFTLRDLPDLVAIEESLAKAKHVVFLGAGLVALETAAALLARGVAVTAIEKSERILPRQLDQHVSDVFRAKFEQAGMQFALGRNLASVELEQGRAVAALLDDGTRLPCDMMIVATGVRPNTAFLESAGLTIGRGLTVNDEMQTSHPDVFGAGDVCALTGTWAPAVRQGAIAAQNMVTPGSARFEADPVPKNSMAFFGEHALSYGTVIPPDETGYDIATHTNEPNYARIVKQDGKVVGALFFGPKAAGGDVDGLLREYE